MLRLVPQGRFWRPVTLDYSYSELIHHTGFGILSVCSTRVTLFYYYVSLVIDLSIRFILRFLRLTGVLPRVPSPDGSHGRLGGDTPLTPLTVYFSVVEYVQLYSISSYLLRFSPVEQANIFSDQVILFRTQLMRLFP